MFSTLLAVSAVVAVTTAADAPEPVRLTYAFTTRIELAPPVEQGEIEGGRRRFVPIIGGTITGPWLTGTVLAGGGDWQTIYPDGFTRIEARYFLKAADGTVIGIHNPGVRVASAEVSGRMARGERVDPSAYYFRASPVFDPPPGPHAWMRGKTFVGRGVRMPDHVLMEIFIVE